MIVKPALLRLRLPLMRYQAEFMEGLPSQVSDSYVIVHFGATFIFDG